jgi:hypothetical protein
MKITKQQLKQIIKEELMGIFNEVAPSTPMDAEVNNLDTILIGSSSRALGLFPMLEAGTDANFTSALRNLEEFAYKIKNRDIREQVHAFYKQLLEDEKDLASTRGPAREDRMLAISTFGRQKWRNIKTSIQGT